MAQVKLVTLYTAAVGLNTRLDPQRLTQGTKDAPGLIELSQAVNVSIDDRGMVELRKGYVSKQVGEFHSLYCNGGDCFAAQDRSSDTAIYMVEPATYALTGVRSGLAKGARISFAQANALTFYANGVQNGVIDDGVSSAWTVDAYNGPESNLTFLPSVPVGELLDYDGAGTMCIAIGQNLHFNRFPFLFGLYAVRDVITMPTPITMVKSVPGGWYVSDEEHVRFFGGPVLKDAVERRVTNSPALRWGCAFDLVQASDIGIEDTSFGAVWAGADGVYYGAADGTVLNLTDDRVEYPRGKIRGACLVHNKQIIHTVY